jgi:hypothetical protein
VTLARALATARMYLVDLSILEGVPLFCKGTGESAERRWAPPARAVFFRHGDGHLHPVAIQLGRDPATCPVFTPNDGPLDWLAAKIYFRSAEGNVHQIATLIGYGANAVCPYLALESIRHLSRTDGGDEAAAVAALERYRKALEKGLLKIINGDQAHRLELQHAELGGIVYRINQLVQTLTGEEESDESGRVSRPPSGRGPSEGV